MSDLLVELVSSLKPTLMDKIMVNEKNYASSDDTSEEIPALNEETMNHLLRELRPTKDAKAAEDDTRANAKLLNISNWQNGLKIDISKSVANAKEQAPSSKWTELELMALRRAAIALIDFDGIGRGVTGTEAEGISSRFPASVTFMARHLAMRHDTERGGIDPLVAAIAATAFQSNIFATLQD